jgi:DNA-directed RNA polymerase subunit M/transcription elongation factor TFIIS
MVKKPNTILVRTPAQSMVKAREYVFDKLVMAGLTNDMSRELERNIMTYTKKVCTDKNVKLFAWSNIQLRRIYLRKVRMILNNINSIIEMLKDERITLEDITLMTHYALKPELWDPILERIKKRAILTMITDCDEKFDGLLKCDACKSWKTRYIELQTRSADEPLTVFATCLDCNIHWRF